MLLVERVGCMIRLWCLDVGFPLLSSFPTLVFFHLSSIFPCFLFLGLFSPNARFGSEQSGEEGEKERNEGTREVQKKRERKKEREMTLQQ